MDNKADAKFWRELIDWAKTLPESARLGLNDDGRTVELYGVSHDMRRHLQFLAKRGGLDNPEAAASVLYLNLRSRAAKEMALKGSSRHFHPLLYERTAYRGHRRIEERRVDGFFQPLREVLLEYCSEQLMGTTLSPAHSQLGVKDSAGKRPGKAAGRRPKPERRRAIAQAIMRHGDDWWDHLDDILEELDERQVDMGRWAGKVIELGDGQTHKAWKWRELGLAAGAQRASIRDGLRKYVQFNPDSSN